MADGVQGAIGALGELAGEIVGAGLEIGKTNLPLGDFVAVGRRDAAAGGTARLLPEHVGAVVLPREVEQAVREVGDQRALVDEQARKHGIALVLERPGLPPDLARIGDDAAADAEVRNGGHSHAGRQQVELQAGGGVARVGAAVDLDHDRDGRAGQAKLLGDFGDEPAFAFVAEADAHVGDELAAER